MGGGGWIWRKLYEEAAEGWGLAIENRDYDGGLGLRKGGWLQMLEMSRVCGKLSIWR